MQCAQADMHTVTDPYTLPAYTGRGLGFMCNGHDITFCGFVNAPYQQMDVLYNGSAILIIMTFMACAAK